MKTKMSIHKAGRANETTANVHSDGLVMVCSGGLVIQDSNRHPSAPMLRTCPFKTMQPVYVPRLGIDPRYSIFYVQERSPHFRSEEVYTSYNRLAKRCCPCEKQEWYEDRLATQRAKRFPSVLFPMPKSRGSAVLPREKVEGHRAMEVSTRIDEKLHHCGKPVSERCR